VTRRPDSERWRQIAARQADAIHRDQLLDAGVSRHQILWRVDRAEFRVVHPSVYLTSNAPPGRHTRAWAAVLYAGRPAFVSHRIAAALYLPRLTAPDEADVTVLGHNPGRRSGIGVHRVKQLKRSEVGFLDGLPLTSPARTVLDLAATRPRTEVEYALQELIFLRKLADRDLRRILAVRPRHRGARVLRDILELEGPSGSGYTRSEAERAFQRLIRDAELQRPIKNRRIEGFDIDTVWPDRRLIVEIDGGIHDNALARRRDRDRDGRLEAAGWRVIRFTRREVIETPLVVAARLAQALAEAA
jgi:very-short-patch-repair endonuclease